MTDSQSSAKMLTCPVPQCESNPMNKSNLKRHLKLKHKWDEPKLQEWNKTEKEKEANEKGRGTYR